MKKVIIIISLVCIAIFASGQGSQGSINSKEYYLQKSKNIRTTAWVLLAGGTTMMVIGLSVWGSSDFLFPESEAGPNLTAGGILIDLISIPFFISASKNARKAATFSLHNQDMLLPNPHILALKPQPSLTLKIQF